VADKNFNIIKTIKKFLKDIVIPDETAASIQHYVDDLKKLNPFLTKRRSPLFPSYLSERRLHRHWAAFDSKYIDILHAGINYYFLKALKSGETKKDIIDAGSIQLRISEREFEAVASNNKIPAGKSIDDKCSENILELFEQAEHISNIDPRASSKAEAIMKKYERELKNFRSKTLFQSYREIRVDFERVLSPFLRK
jgi:hypothetical protein